MNMLTNYLPKEKLINLSLLLFLALILPAAMVLVQQTHLVDKRAAVAAIKGSLTPATVTKNPGETFDLTVDLTNISATDKAIRVAEATLQYDTNVLEIQGTTAGTEACGPKKFSANPCDQTNFPSKACTRVYDNDAKIQLACYRSVDEILLVIPPNAVKSAAKVTFKVKATATVGTTTTITLLDLVTPDPASNSENIADGKENAVITIGSGGSTSTPTPTPTGGPSVDLKFKIRDVTGRPGSCYNGTTMNFKVKFVKDGSTQSFDSVSFTPTDQNITADGIWTLHVNGVNHVAGNYDIYIKGPKQLQKKFPARALTAAESQTVDLTTMGSRYYLEGGDIPRSNAEQDGNANTSDSLYLVGCFDRETEAACLMRPDLDYNCSVNSMDNNILNNTIYSRWEDEVS